MDSLDQRGWYSRGYLPHLDFRSAIQGVTFRLADALPKAVILRMKNEADRIDERRLLLEQIARSVPSGCRKMPIWKSALPAG